MEITNLARYSFGVVRVYDANWLQRPGSLTVGRFVNTVSHLIRGYGTWFNLPDESALYTPETDDE